MMILLTLVLLTLILILIFILVLVLREFRHIFILFSKPFLDKNVISQIDVHIEYI